MATPFGRGNPSTRGGFYCPTLLQRISSFYVWLSDAWERWIPPDLTEEGCFKGQRNPAAFPMVKGKLFGQNPFPPHVVPKHGFPLWMEKKITFLPKKGLPNVPLGFDLIKKLHTITIQKKKEPTHYIFKGLSLLFNSVYFHSINIFGFCAVIY